MALSKCLKKIALSLLVLPVLAINAHAAAADFLNKTFLVSADLGGKSRTTFRFYIAKDGRVFAYANNTGNCSDTGAEGEINATRRSKYSCPSTAGGTFSVTTIMTTTVTGDTIRIEENDSNYSRLAGTSRVKYRYSWQFDGSTCGHAAYSYSAASLSGSGKNVRCSWKAGR